MSLECAIDDRLLDYPITRLPDSILDYPILDNPIRDFPIIYSPIVDSLHLRRNRQIENRVRPVKRRVDVKQPMQVQPARRIASKAGEEKPIGDDDVSFD